MKGHHAERGGQDNEYTFFPNCLVAPEGKNQRHSMERPVQSEGNGKIAGEMQLAHDAYQQAENLRIARFDQEFNARQATAQAELILGLPQ